jgi:hypothetical protein
MKYAATTLLALGFLTQACAKAAIKDHMGAGGSSGGTSAGAAGSTGGSSSPGTACTSGGSGSSGAAGDTSIVDAGTAGAPSFDASSVDLGPSAGFQAVMPGEHPRLFFRKYDLPMLKAKAATPDGAALIAQLKASLGGGEAVRTDLKNFTLTDAFGFGLLYQLTGQQKYADACKQATMLYLGGTPDREAKFNWAAPSGYMDYVGPSFSSVAMAYDVCYDGWDDAFRMMVAQKLMSYSCPNHKIEGWPSSGDTVTLEQMALMPPSDPGLWTFGPSVAGVGLTLIATMGDPGVDPMQTAKLQAGVDTNFERVFTEGYGDMGCFWRMAQQGKIVSNEGMSNYVQALRVALNKDQVTNRPGVQWMNLHWVFDLVKDPKGGRHARYPDRHDSGQLVSVFQANPSMWDEGTFWEGFGNIRDDQKPAMLWTYLNLKPEPDNALYPHHAVFAFLNLPFGVTPKNPGDVIPHVMQDHTHGLYEFRNRWQDQNDILVTALFGGAGDDNPTAPVTVWGFGFRTTFGAFPVHGDRPRPKVETLVASKDGSGVLSLPGTGGGSASSLAVDFGGSSGADALIAFVGSRADLQTDPGRREDFGARAASTMLMLGTTPVYVMTLQSGAAPAATVSGDHIAVGQQTISWNGTSLVLGKMNP